ncbi:MAG: MFS transporter [SAR324 cluster bacterium]|nr:MFS transporter [SAR324 cluster bacterium]
MAQSEESSAAAPKPWAWEGRSWGALAACGGAHILHDGMSALVYVLLPVWAKAFALNLTQAAALKSTYAGCMALFQVPVSFLSERIGERGLLVAGTALAALGYLLMGWTGGFLSLLFMLALAGLGSSVQHPLASSLVARAFETGQRRAALGTYNFSGDLGKMLLPGLAALSLGAYPWSHTTTGVGLFGLAAALLLPLALRGVEPTPPAAPQPERVSASPAGRGIIDSAGRGWGILDPAGFAALSLIGVVDAATRGGILVLLPFLLIEKGASLQMVGLGLTLVFAGGACGKFVCGLLAERIGIVRTVIATELATAAGIGLVVIAPPQWQVLVLPLFGVALNGTSSVLYGTVAELVTPQRRARAFAVFYTVITGSTALAPLLYGALADHAGIPLACAIMALTVLLAIPLSFRLRV